MVSMYKIYISEQPPGYWFSEYCKTKYLCVKVCAGLNISVKIRGEHLFKQGANK